MDWLKDLFHQLTDVKMLVRVGGLSAMTAIVFAETGLMIGFFLPGDSLLFTAGALAAQGHFNIWSVNALLILAAIVGDTVGYWIGRRAGPALFNRPRSRLFNPAHLRRAHDFYEKHGGKTIILARFMPIIRTFAPVVAGMGRMNYPRFVSFNVFGGFLWVVLMTWAGYFLGRVPFVARNFELVVLFVVFLSILPGIVAYARELWIRRRKAKADPRPTAGAAGREP
jgi:membrane-associated protein